MKKLPSKLGYFKKLKEFFPCSPVCLYGPKLKLNVGNLAEEFFVISPLWLQQSPYALNAVSLLYTMVVIAYG